jgi:hypothetical protein
MASVSIVLQKLAPSRNREFLEPHDVLCMHRYYFLVRVLIDHMSSSFSYFAQSIFSLSISSFTLLA